MSVSFQSVVTRRLLRIAVSLVFSVNFLSSGLANAAAPMVTSQAPGYYRTHLGAFEVTVLSDGTASRDVDKIMHPGELVRQAIVDSHEHLPIELSINNYLINTGKQLVLVDTGAGELFGPHAGGLLIRHLKAAGYQPEQVDAVLLTHIHGGHSGGLAIGGQRLFPNATVYVDRRDSEFWLGESARLAHPEKSTTFRQSHQTMDPYVVAGKLKSFDGATQLFPGIRSVPAYGHTPGHSAYLIESQGQRLMLWGDTVHVAEIQFSEPTVSIEYDVDHDAAVISRQRLFADAARDGYLLGSAHISFPGLGHIRKQKDKDDSYVWAPAPYQSLRSAQ